jgi:hypothetical protein
MPVAYLWEFKITQGKVPGRPEAPLSWKEYALTEDSMSPACAIPRSQIEQENLCIEFPQLIGEVNWGWAVHDATETAVGTTHGGELGLELEYSAQEIYQRKMYDPV